MSKLGTQKASDGFQLFTSLRYDSRLLTSGENSRKDLNFVTPSPFYMLVYHRDRMSEAAQHFDFTEVVKKLEDGVALHELLLEAVEKHMGNHGGNQALKLRLLFDPLANLSIEMAPTPEVPLSTLYPTSFDPPHAKATFSAKDTFRPSHLTGGALGLGPTDSFATAGPTEAHQSEWKIKLDAAPTPSSPFTRLKTTKRDMYDASRNRALPENPEAPAKREVMLYNEVNEITEGTLTSLYLYRGGRWVTPPVGMPSGEFNGTAVKESNEDEGELRKPFQGRWGHSVRSAKVGAGGQRGTSRRWALDKGICMEEPVHIDTVKVGEGIWISNGVRGFGYGKVVA